MKSSSIAIALILSIGWLLSTIPAGAQSDDPFQATWARTDRPVSKLQAARTWLWGPQPFTPHIQESYTESPGGERTVIYYDKGRMEIGDPNGDSGSDWFVTSGLLATEMVTGNMQIGDTHFEQRGPAQINVAGDPDGATSPTYATFTALLDAPAAADGATIIQRLDRSGAVTVDPSLASYGVVAAAHVVEPGIDHQVASVFWEFMNSHGLVEVNGSLVEDALFPTPFYATGLPITEPYWTTVNVGEVETVVLVQVFECRVLTYTASNLDGWKVESGNDGQHYYLWRYGYLPQWQQMAFSSTRSRSADDPLGSDVFIMHADGSGLQQLTTMAGNEENAAWSPDGTRIAFVHTEPDDSAWRIFVMDADGSNQMPLTPHSLDGSSGRTLISYPVWSPDGTRIAFIGGVESVESTDYGLYLVNADGTDLTRLTQPDLHLATFAPAWSPDGTRIAITSGGIDIINVDGSGMTRLSFGMGPTWSPDGSRIAYLFDGGVWVMDDDGANQRHLGDLPVYYSPATWSPDGTRLATFSALDGGSSQIFVIDVESGEYSAITPATSDASMGDLLPIWSADGLRIAFIRADESNHEIIVVNADGSGEWNASNNAGIDFEPAWRPLPAHR